MAKNVVSLKLDNTSYEFRPYGTCSTAAGTAAKTVAITNFTLCTGATVLVKFTYANTAASPTLNVNSTGAKSITGTGVKPITAGAVHEFRYDGTNWEIVGSDNNTTYSNATQSAAGLMSSTDKAKLDGIANNANNYTLPTASSTALGGVKVVGARTSAITTVGTSATTNRYYGVEVDKDGKAFVNVPWTDTNTDTNTTYSVGTGLAIANDTKIYANIKPTKSTLGVNDASTTSGRQYPVQEDKDGYLSVNVPWTNTTYTLPNCFKTIDCPRGTDPVADSTTDTLTLADDGIITVTGDSTNDKISFAHTKPANSPAKTTSGLYKVTIDAAGHITAASAVQKSDITGLGIPGSDNYTLPTTSNSNAAPTISALTADYITELTNTALTAIKVTGFATASTSRLTTYGLIFNATSNTTFAWPTSVLWAGGEPPCGNGLAIGAGFYEIIFTYTPNLKKYTATWAKYS